MKRHLTIGPVLDISATKCHLQAVTPLFRTWWIMIKLAVLQYTVS